MTAMPMYHIPPFRIDLQNEQLWREVEEVHLTPKAFAVLRHLLLHAGQLMTKEALLAAVWPETYVSEAALVVCIRELRQALGDQARAPCFIETVPRRGYRFIAPIATVPRDLPPLVAPATRLSSRSCVGREAELTQLQQGYTTALQGIPQVIFLTGEAGIGKTTLVETFVAQCGAEHAIWIGHGQCIEQYGAGEPYLPLLEALGRLCRGPDGAQFLTLLEQQAPSWILHMPGLLAAEVLETAQRRSEGMTRERMLRELAEAVESLSASRPLVLVLEDLDWSDVSTLEWLAYVARRRDPARLLVLGTYRPVEAVMHDHPLRRVAQELQRQGYSRELTVDYLSEAGVASYMAERLGDGACPDGFVRVAHQRTNGNPLFLITMVDELMRQGILKEAATEWQLMGGLEAAGRVLPASLRQLIEYQFEQLDGDAQMILEAASVAGVEFTAEAVAAGIDQDAEVVEAQCMRLARRNQFIRAQEGATWPDGTITACFGFIHALYQEVLYTQVPPGRCGRMHRQIGTRLETGYGRQARERAAELAVHFVQGRDAPRALPYVVCAAQQTVQWNAHQEALMHVANGLELLITLPDTSAYRRHEVELYLTRGMALAMSWGAAAPEVEEAFVQARELCQQEDESDGLLRALIGLVRCYRYRGESQIEQRLGEEVVCLAQRVASPLNQQEAHFSLGVTLLLRGDLLEACRHFTRSMKLVDPQQRLSVNYGVLSRSQAALALWTLGYPTQALAYTDAAVTQARALAMPVVLTEVLIYAAVVYDGCRDDQQVAALADEALSVATEWNLAYWAAAAMCWRSWASVTGGRLAAGLSQMHEGLAAYEATGAKIGQPHFLTCLAEAYGRCGV